MSDDPVSMTSLLDARALPIRREGLQCHELDGEAVLYHLAHHAMHYLNRTAYLIWLHCDGLTQADQLPARVAQSFGIEENESLARDTAASLEHLTGSGLIDWRRLPV